jgi:hypothetical protein
VEDLNESDGENEYLDDDKEMEDDDEYIVWAEFDWTVNCHIIILVIESLPFDPIGNGFVPCKHKNGSGA